MAQSSIKKSRFGGRARPLHFGRKTDADFNDAQGGRHVHEGGYALDRAALFRTANIPDPIKAGGALAEPLQKAFLARPRPPGHILPDFERFLAAVGGLVESGTMHRRVQRFEDYGASIQHLARGHQPARQIANRPAPNFPLEGLSMFRRYDAPPPLG